MDLKAGDSFRFDENVAIMKKVLAYILAAVLLGTVTMMAPFGLFVGKINDEYENLSPTSVEKTRNFSADLEETYGLSQATYPLDMLYIVFMLVSSFAIALGVMRYSMKRAVS